jgi:LacI family transcriptional regulator
MKANGTTPSVAVWIETSRCYGRGLIRGVAAWVRQHGPWSIYFTPHGLREPVSKWLSHWRGDGILARIDDHKMARMFRARKVPLIDLRGRLLDVRLPIVGLDNRPVSQLAFEHLRDRGFRHYGFCGVRRGEHVHMDQRREFFHAFVEQAGFECDVYDARSTRTRQPDWEQEQKRLGQWLTSLPKPIGIMACNDDRGQQLLDACRRVGIAVPDQVAVIGVDNDEELCSLSTPALTSVEVNAERIGYGAAALLDEMMQGKRVGPRVEILFAPSHVVTRLSTDTLAVEDVALARALRFIRDHACNGIDVEDVVGASRTSRRYLERQMQSLLGRSPNQEILRVRIERAQALLLETDLALGVIARQTGFRSSKYFGDAFVRHLERPPGEFRRQARAAPANE